MKLIAAMALLLNLGLATVYAQDKPVKMTFSGTEGASAIDLQISGSHNGEFNSAGNGALGPFTFRNVEAGSASPRRRPALARKIRATFQLWPAPVYFASKMEVY